MCFSHPAFGSQSHTRLGAEYCVINPIRPRKAKRDRAQAFLRKWTIRDPAVLRSPLTAVGGSGRGGVRGRSRAHELLAPPPFRGLLDLHRLDAAREEVVRERRAVVAVVFIFEHESRRDGVAALPAKVPTGKIRRILARPHDDRGRRRHLRRGGRAVGPANESRRVDTAAVTESRRVAAAAATESRRVAAAAATESRRVKTPWP